jgi:hypothetical protein
MEWQATIEIDGKVLLVEEKKALPSKERRDSGRDNRQVGTLPQQTKFNEPNGSIECLVCLRCRFKSRAVVEDIDPV